MADFGGFQVKTPQEVLAELAAQRQQIATLPPRAQRTANIQFQIANLFGNPELKKARALEERMNAVNASVPPSSDLASEKQRLSQMFDAVKGEDPAAAAQISQQILAIDNEMVERKRLQQNADRSDRAVDIQDRQLKLQEERFGRLPDFSNFGFLVDPNDPANRPKMVDLRDPEQAAQYENAAQNGLLALTQEQAVARLGREQVRAASGTMIPKSAFNQRIQGYRAYNQFLDQGDKLLNRFVFDERTGLLTLDVVRGVRNLAAESKAALDEAFGTPNDEENLGMIRTKLNEFLDNSGTTIESNQRALYESAILNMGYVLARGLDSGGRLSDQDVNMAIRMLTGGSAIFEDGTISVPAEQIVGVFLDRAADIRATLGADNVDAILFSKQQAEAGVPEAQVMQEIFQSTESRYNKLEDTARGFLGDEQMEIILNPGAAAARRDREEALQAQAEAEEAAKAAERQRQIDDADSVPTLDDVPLTEEESLSLTTLMSRGLRGEQLTEGEIERIKRNGLWNQTLEANQRRGR